MSAYRWCEKNQPGEPRQWIMTDDRPRARRQLSRVILHEGHTTKFADPAYESRNRDNRFVGFFKILTEAQGECARFEDLLRVSDVHAALAKTSR